MAAAATEKTFDIPKRYKAMVYDKPGSISTKLEELDTPEPLAGDVLVRLLVLITLSSSSPTDIFMLELIQVFATPIWGLWRTPGAAVRSCRLRCSCIETDPFQVPYPTQPGQVGGHEGVGIVHKLGPGTENGLVKVGDRVGIKVATS